jgi:hypothetical protein
MLKRNADNFGSRSSLDMLPPPSLGKWRSFERLALQVRNFAGLGLHARLDPLALAQSLNIKIVFPDQIDGLSDATRQLLDSQTGWSGGGTRDLGDGTYIVILNRKHSAGRRSATLMEEICHILFGHKQSGLNTDWTGGRTYDVNIEEEAYSVGAAALVPYQTLKHFFLNGESVKDIALKLGVSRSLIIYRARGLRLHEFIT